MIDKTKLDEIKKSLPQGALKNIQAEAKVSYQTVLNFFKGASENVKVAEAVIKIYRERVSVSNELNNLPSKLAI